MRGFGVVLALTDDFHGTPLFDVISGPFRSVPGEDVSGLGPGPSRLTGAGLTASSLARRKPYLLPQPLCVKGSIRALMSIIQTLNVSVKNKNG